MKNFRGTTFLCLLFIALWIPATAQSFLPADWQQGIIFNGNAFNSPPPGDASMRHLIDTTMCGYTYARVCRNSTWPGSNTCNIIEHIRKTGNRVYRGGNCNWPDDVLFDFGLVVGDTITVAQSLCHTGLYGVDSVYTITLLDASQRKYFVLHGMDNWNTGDTLRWIEDIGDINRGFIPNCDFEGGRTNLICHKENGIKRYENVGNLVLADCDTLTIVAVTPEVGTAKLASVAPNPFQHTLRFTALGDQALEISVYDLAGRLRLQQTFSTTTVLQTEGLACGIYLYQLRDADGHLQSGRVVRE